MPEWVQPADYIAPRLGYEPAGNPNAAENASQYLTLSLSTSLPNERLFTPGTGLSAVDGGAGGTYTLNASAAGAPVNASYVVVGLDATLTDDRRLQAGSGLTLVDGGAGADVSFSISSAAITSAMLRNSAGFSVIGKFATGSGVPADIVAGTDTVLGRNGSGDLAFATVATGQIANDAVTYAKIQNVTDARLLGRSAGSSGDVQEITVGSGLSLSAGALTATAGPTVLTRGQGLAMVLGS